MGINGITNIGVWKHNPNKGVWQDAYIDLSTEIEADVQNTEQFRVDGISSETKLRGLPATVSQFEGEVEKLP